MDADYSDNASPFARLLRFWRKVLSISQEQLAQGINSTSRHISRLENSRSRPSKSMVYNIAQVLSLGQRDSNLLLLSAGFSPARVEVSFKQPEFNWMRKALTLTLKALDPYPTTVMDSETNILMVNKGWVNLFQQNIGAAKLAEVSDHFEFLFLHTLQGEEFNDTLSLILMSLYQASILVGNKNPEHQRRLQALADLDFVPADWQQRAARLEPMASFKVQVQTQGQRHKFYSVSQTFGALGPNAFVSEPNLTVTTLYPDDEQLDLSISPDTELAHPLLYY